MYSCPHVTRSLADATQFRFLIGVSQEIPFHRRRKATLRAQRQTLQRHKRRCLADALFELGQDRLTLNRPPLVEGDADQVPGGTGAPVNLIATF